MKATLLVTLAVVLDLAAGHANSSRLTVQTSTGSFTGLIDPAYPSTRQFRSIPFAEPPVASRRWLPPQKLAQSDEHRYSVKFPPSCPQFVSAVPVFWNSPLTKGNLIYNGAQNDTSGLVGEATSEDCLHLAVWTPSVDKIPEEGLPVMFFMTGGGFVMGGVELPWQIPVSWVERSQSHIVVSVNYRVNIFGFPNARGLANGEQNLGILDQRAALEWVRDNIASFGGDPGRIMHWGRSAGAISTDIHTYAYAGDPIAQSYYIESGTAFSLGPVPPPAYSNFTFVAQNVGCGSPCGSAPCSADEAAKAELDCMRLVSMTQISNFVGQYADNGTRPALSFSISADDRVVFSDYAARSEEGLIARRPTTISYTANEFSSLVPWPANLTAGPDQALVDAGTITFGVCATYNSTVYRNRLGPEVPVFRFQYAAEFPNLNVYDWLGAYHNSETSLIFGAYNLLDGVANSTAYQDEVSRSLQDHILAFAKDPYAGPQTLGWEPSVTDAPNGGSLIRFGGSTGEVVRTVDGLEVDGVCLGKGVYNPFP
ncbi:Carboxylesterase-like protein 16 [Elsinoe fawcettii]|nr:Carboxylesterase-like protein 16 [Elsinoe fawcettii]